MMEGGGGMLYLMEDREVRGVDLVPAIDIGGQQPVLFAVGEAFDLMCGGMGSEHELGVEVVGVALLASRMVIWEAELVEVLERTDDRIRVAKQLEAGQLAGNRVFQDPDRMPGLLVQALVESWEE
jgi:hypothetical protein